MVAKKSKGWRSGKREVRPRMVQMTRHLVVTEGKETEPRYFEGVRAALCAADERKVAVIVKGTGKHTLDLLDFIIGPIASVAGGAGNQGGLYRAEDISGVYRIAHGDVDGQYLAGHPCFDFHFLISPFLISSKKLDEKL